MYEKATEMMPMDVDLRIRKIKYWYLCGKDNQTVSELSNLKKMVTIVKPLNNKLNELKMLIESMGRLNDGICFYDNLKESMLNGMVENLYSSIKKYPHDSRLLFRIVTIWQELGRLDKIYELLEDYIFHNKYLLKNNDNTLLLLRDICEYLEKGVGVRQGLLDERRAGVQGIITAKFQVV